jgi:DNA-binding CsgD family transcriptional regulator
MLVTHDTFRRLVNMLRRHHIRDGLYCPFRRWALTFWSPKLLDRLSPDTRAMLFTVAGLAIGRIDTLVRNPEQFETIAKLSERELSVWRLISYGQSNAEAAAHLKIGPETVKHHVKRAMRKLKARDRAQAVASAIRQGLMSRTRPARRGRCRSRDAALVAKLRVLEIPQWTRELLGPSVPQILAAHTGAVYAIMPGRVNFGRGTQMAGIIKDESRHDPSRGFPGKRPRSLAMFTQPGYTENARALS